MIADVYIRPAFLEIFAPMKGVANESKHAKDPGPERKELVSDPGVFPANKERKYNAGKQHQHEDGENQQYPESIKG